MVDANLPGFLPPLIPDQLRLGGREEVERILNRVKDSHPEIYHRCIRMLEQLENSPPETK